MAETPEMVERVVRAQWKCLDEIARKDGARLGSLDDLPEEELHNWLSLVRAAIAAMREPTEAMLRAKLSPDDSGLPVDTVEGYLDYWTAEAVWHAMVDAALND
jgi:hypothetical protein